MKRRTFVHRLPVLPVVLSAGSTVALGACAGAPYLRPVPTRRGLTLPAAELGPDGDAFVLDSGMERPIYVRRADSGGYTAVLASCTHRGCQPEPVADRLSCPCHGSEFTFDGAVLSGPAESPLVRYPVEEVGGEIHILLQERSR